MSDEGMRISDAERDAAAADLGEHFAQGRLTADEHEERLASIWSAKTRGEIPPVFADLPSPYSSRLAPPAPQSEREDRARSWNAGLRPFRGGLPAPVVVVLAVLVAVIVITHLPLFLIGFAVFVVLRHRGRRWHGGHAHPGWR